MPEKNLKYSTKENNTLPLRILSSDILKDHRRLIIEHNGEEYILRITRSGKLILIK
jgi:hemin uptake protein HemP